MGRGPSAQKGCRVFVSEPWYELMRGVIRQAAEEATNASARAKRRADAIVWLQDPTALSLAEVVGLDTRRVIAWARKAEQIEIKRRLPRLLKEIRNATRIDRSRA